MTATPTYEPALGADPVANHRTLAALLAGQPPGVVRLPVGTYPLERGVVLGAGWTLAGAEPSDATPGTWLSTASPDSEPIVHVLGSDVEVTGLGLLPPPSAPGEHAGDWGTAITLGRYLYDEAPRWIERIRISGVHVRRSGDRAANCVSVMGAVRDVQISDVTVAGGCTGLAVHWGAAGSSVATLVGPTYHPHRLDVSGLRVSDAFEGFYLSSVHDVRVSNACLSDVDIGFRLLPGDNTDRYHPADGAVVGRDIEIADVCIAWRGALYGLRVAGWGRSEVDGLVTTLTYRDVAIRDVVMTAVDPPDGSAPAGGALSRSPVVLERAYGVSLHNVNIGSDRRPAGGSAGAACCPARAGAFVG